SCASSRSRYTSGSGDWSSDVCSSDRAEVAVRTDVRVLVDAGAGTRKNRAESNHRVRVTARERARKKRSPQIFAAHARYEAERLRSEERRGGRQARAQWSGNQ